jgi:hypothetical protein
MIKLKKNREYFGRDIPPELMETRKAHVSGRTGLSSDSESRSIKRKYEKIPVHKVEQRYQSFLTRDIIL